MISTELDSFDHNPAQFQLGDPRTISILVSYFSHDIFLLNSHNSMSEIQLVVRKEFCFHFQDHGMDVWDWLIIWELDRSIIYSHYSQQLLFLLRTRSPRRPFRPLLAAVFVVLALIDVPYDIDWYQTSLLDADSAIMPAASACGIHSGKTVSRGNRACGRNGSWYNL